MAVLDFPSSPVVGQDYTGPNGAVYTWDGDAWTVGFYDTSTQAFEVLGDVLSQARTLLQDTDLDSGEYRYSTDSLVMNVNQAYLEMYRIRPDIFLENKFKIPQFNVANLDAPLVVEPQFIPSVVYYVVGMAQLRDDEPTQDARASIFLGKLVSSLAGVA